MKRPKIRHLDQIKQKLDGLRETREKADYYLGIADLTHVEVADAIGKANRLVRELRTSLPEEKVRRIRR